MNFQEIKNQISVPASPTERNRLFCYLSIFSLIFYFSRNSDMSFVISLLVVMFFSFLYVIYFMISEKLISEIIVGIIFSVIITLSATIFPPLVIVLIIFVLYNITQAIKSVKALFPIAVFSLILWGMLYLNIYFYKSIALKLLVSFSYFSIIIAYSSILSKVSMKFGLMRLSIMFFSAPLIYIMIAAIAVGLRNFFNTTFSTITKNVNVTQNVASHMRGDVAVNAHTRNVTRAVTETVAERSVGTGAVTIGTAGSITSNIEQENNANK